MTVTVAVAVAGGLVCPVHVSEYVVVLVGLTVAVPEVPDTGPVQDVAFVLAKVSVKDWPD